MQENGDGLGLEPVRLDGKFLKGVAISVWQNGGDDCDSNWTRFSNGTKLFSLKSNISDGSKGVFPGFWEK